MYCWRCGLWVGGMRHEYEDDCIAALVARIEALEVKMRVVELRGGPWAGKKISIGDTHNSIAPRDPRDIEAVVERGMLYMIEREGDKWIGRIENEEDLIVCASQFCMERLQPRGVVPCSEKDDARAMDVGYPPYYEGCMCVVVRKGE